jgi:hypothetical protein
MDARASVTSAAGSPRPEHSEQPDDRLRDFTADKRLLLLSGMAMVVGSAGARAAWVLQRLIYHVTNIS